MTTAMPPITKQAKRFQMNLRRGHDFILPLRYKRRVPDSDPPQYEEADFPDDIVIVIVVDRGSSEGPLESDPAPISGSFAVPRIESSVHVAFKEGWTWRVEFRHPDTPTLNRVPINGVIVREDGDQDPL